MSTNTNYLGSSDIQKGKKKSFVNFADLLNNSKNNSNDLFKKLNFEFKKGEKNKIRDAKETPKFKNDEDFKIVKRIRKNFSNIFAEPPNLQTDRRAKIREELKKLKDHQEKFKLLLKL